MKKLPRNIRAILRGVMSLVLLVYLAVATVAARHIEAASECAGLTIEVNDTSAHPFVTARELARELHELPSRARGMRLSDIDTDSIRAMLQRIDKIESVRVVRYTDGRIRVFVEPMRPVARVFDGQASYYINRDGKRISANARYRVDVPVIQAHFNDTTFPPTSLLPLLDYIEASDKWRPMVSMVKADSPHDVCLIPSVRGQVIVLGTADAASLPDKFARLDRFYADVVGTRGWNYYDTISVKFARQVVATRRDKTLPDLGYVVDAEAEETIDIASMSVGDDVAPGDAIAEPKARDTRSKGKSSTPPAHTP